MLNDAAWRERVQALLPDLEIRELALNQDGLMNDVVIVNRSLVVRFAKTERGAALLAGECRLLRQIAPRVPAAVPAPIAVAPGAMAYRYLEGEPLQIEHALDCDPGGQQALAAQIGRFLHALHGAPAGDEPLPATLAAVTRDEWEDLRGRCQKLVYPLLQAHQIDWAERLFGQALSTPGFFDYPPAIIHGDLAPYHLLVAPGEPRLAAVIDFGMAGLGDPAVDLGGIISIYGEWFLGLMRGEYPDMAPLLPRARFYAQALELEWTLRGLESGEQFWFTAHLGTARDVRQ